MSTEEKELIKAGRELHRMISDLRTAAANGEATYCRRVISFPGGQVHLMMTTDDEVAAYMESGIAGSMEVVSRTPASEVN